MKLIIPAYIYPGAAPRTEWSNWIAHAREVSHIIANPGSPGGPGTFTDSNYAAVIAAAQLAGIKILGYVDLNYARPDTTTPLDTFNAGASQALTARTGWGSGKWNSGDVSMTTDATPTYATNNNVASSNIWNTQFGANMEAITSEGSFIDSHVLIVRGNSPSSTLSEGYVGRVGFSGAMSIELITTSTLASGSFAAPLAGDQFCLRRIGNTITLRRKLASGGDWTILLSVSDSTYAGAGYIGLFGGAGNTPRIDSYGGGTVAATAVQQVADWNTLYGVKDIFFDQAPSDAANIGYVQIATSAAYAAGATTVMLNHGTDADVGYSAISDIQCTFEGTKASYDAWNPSQAWELSAPEGRICHLVYNCASNAEVDKVFSQARMQNVSFMRGADTSIWFAQSAFIDEEYQQVDFINAPRLVGGFGTRSGGR